MEITLIITIGVIVCVAIICYASVKSSNNNIKIEILKSVAMSDYQVDHNSTIDELKQAMHDIYIILYK